jgi:hypothetical protein
MGHPTVTKIHMARETITVFHFTETNIKYMNNAIQNPDRRDLILSTGIT